MGPPKVGVIQEKFKMFLCYLSNVTLVWVDDYVGPIDKASLSTGVDITLPGG